MAEKPYLGRNFCFEPRHQFWLRSCKASAEIANCGNGLATQYTSFFSCNFQLDLNRTVPVRSLNIFHSVDKYSVSIYIKIKNYKLYRYIGIFFINYRYRTSLTIVFNSLFLSFTEGVLELELVIMNTHLSRARHQADYGGGLLLQLGQILPHCQLVVGRWQRHL